MTGNRNKSMNTKDRPKVDAILPLTFMQNALLFHSLSSNDDQGFIHVKVDLIGKLDVNKLKQSWDALIKRHDVFRSSLHWEKIKTPVQVIHKEVNQRFEFEDLRSLDLEERKERIDQFYKDDKERGFNFNKAEMSRIQLFQLKEDHHLMVWSCHHLLWDGWSSANVIRELAEVYQRDAESQLLTLKPIPSSKDYRRDSKENDIEGAKSFWKEYLKGFESPSLLSNYSNSNSKTDAFKTLSFSIDQSVLNKVNNYARQHKLTLTSVLQMAWGITLNAVERTGDVLFGNIVSVRSPRLKNADLMCGLFTNMLPVRIKINEQDTPSKLAIDIQNSQGSNKDFSFVTLEDLQEWTDWPGYLPLFDHIFVVENFPWKDIDLGGLKFSNFRSGITSSYPLTIVAKVVDDFELNFIFDPSKVSRDIVQVLGDNLLAVLDAITSEKDISIEGISEKLSSFTVEDLKDTVTKKSDIPQNQNIEQPSSPLELALTTIWEDIFKREGIGIHDNFFEIGGKSLTAVRLFQRIHKDLDLNAPPILILKYPTIALLADFLGGDKEKLKWKSLIPLKVKGKRRPLFCLHAKGGHVFFYNKFASYLDDDLPIYALQPRSLNGEDSMYNSIEEMAGHYIEEIKSVQPEGPYNILATCFSNAVGLEMAHQLKSEGHEIENLFMVDAAPGKSYSKVVEGFTPLHRANHRLKKSAIYNKAKGIYKKLKGQVETTSEESDFSEKHEKHLGKIFSEYERMPYDGKIILIRSSEFENMQRKDFHVEDWLQIVTKENLEKLVVEGHHQTLFIEPEVQHLADAFNQQMTQIKDASSQKQ